MSLRSGESAENWPAPTAPAIRPPSTWSDPSQHLAAALSDPWFRAIARLQDQIHFTCTTFFRERGLRYLNLPVTTGSVSSPSAPGSDSLPVRARIFDRDVYLADSMQFLLELGVRMAGSGAWYSMLSFRGEDTDARHLNEFSHIEAEIPGTLETAMVLAEDFVRTLARGLRATCRNEIHGCAGDADHLDQLLQAGAFSRLRFEDACRLLGGPRSPWQDRESPIRLLTPEEEGWLLEHFQGPLWVTHFPTRAVPFYQRGLPGEGVSLTADLLLGGGETVGAGERHAGEDDLRASLEFHEVDSTPYAWYLEMKRSTPMRTAGFGMGLERFLQWVLRCQDIRELQLAPRSKTGPFTP